ncbi:hypothetical protein MVLG_05489 [Microbotryum lychnidis-dioicae p1A1 Lamole]|uniref:Uncharacterized protein n=1 Tax=Microbotryum lychnidis-dioicae (strain p1A1 Lamole / MvSl-1064) TaxID=683840 RepID=U5HEE5_USTV1|nr:hypothetical protein MVLG_05489 [Microbotryum lychnidis-dioicae p1A1 Lamole]|eukprot:KDE04050.1 hypothetical protein MVLG_05489 [Microbotryum lychnidis-dioicae p1A1 Lamole]
MTPGGVDFFTGPPATMRLAESEATRPSAGLVPPSPFEMKSPPSLPSSATEPATSPIDVSRTPNDRGVGEGEDWIAAAATTMHVRELQATRNLTDTVIERRSISERLLLEVQRLSEAEEAVRRDERRLASLTSPNTNQAGLAIDTDSDPGPATGDDSRSLNPAAALLTTATISEAGVDRYNVGSSVAPRPSPPSLVGRSPYALP